MSRQFTQGLKGLAILMVFTIHVLGQFGAQGIQFIAGAGVSIFLILSGYGIESSFRTNGLKGYWLKKLLTVLVPYWIVAVLSRIYLHYGANEDLSFVIIRDDLLLKSSNWYVPYIMISYLIFWTVASILKEKDFKYRLVAVSILFAVWFGIEYIFLNGYDESPLRIRQMFCFPVGMWLCDNAERIFGMDNAGDEESRKAVYLRRFILGAVLGFLGIAFTVLYQRVSVRINIPGIPIKELISLFTVFFMGMGIIIIGSIMTKIFEGKIFGFLGGISYELFLVHWPFLGYVYWKFDGIGRFVICLIIGVTVLTLFDRYVLDKLKKKLLT